MTPRQWFRLHSFTGVVTGLLLFVVCWSGAFATLAHEFDWLVTPAARVDPPAQGQPLPWPALIERVQKAYPDHRIRRIRVPEYQSEAAQFIADAPNQPRVRLYVDQYTGRVQGVTSHLNVWRFMRSFHRRLFIQPGTVGILLVSAFGIPLALSLVSALVFYRRWWRRFFRFKAGGGRVFWSESHKLAGLWSLWFVALMAVTGVWYGIEKLGFLDRVFEPEPPPPAPVEVREGRQPLPLETLFARAGELRPELRPAQIAPPGGLGGMVLGIDGQAGNLLVRDRANRIVLNAYTGEPVYNRNASDLTAYQRWVHTADPLHFGDFAGFWVKLVYFVFGLLLCGLILTGTYLHVRRLARNGNRHRWAGTRAALALSMAVVLVSVPFGFYEALHFYGPRVEGTAVLPALDPGVAGFLAGWVLLTLLVLGIWYRAVWRVSSVNPK